MAKKMMGMLKVVLGVLGVVEIVLAFLYADTGFQAMVMNFTFKGKIKGTDPVACKVLMELLCPLFLGMAALNIWSWKMGSTMRPKVAMANVIQLVGVLIVHYRHSDFLVLNSAPVWVCAIGILAVGSGLFLHKLEPGLLTEDKASMSAPKTPRNKKNA